MYRGIVQQRLFAAIAPIFVPRLAEGSMLAHVMGHNFAPFAFQKPRLGLLIEQTALYMCGGFCALKTVWK